MASCSCLNIRNACSDIKIFVTGSHVICTAAERQAVNKHESVPAENLDSAIPAIGDR
jgi:hypothetical protein